MLSVDESNKRLNSSFSLLVQFQLTSTISRNAGEMQTNY